jgi:predicted transposase/invertase (TIGR01784 family)
MEFHVLELPKLVKSLPELGSELEFWVYFLRQAEKMDMEAVPPEFQRFPMILRALEELKMLSQSDLERERYEARRKAQLDHNTFLKEARMTGLEQGLEQGRQQGRQQGLEQGLEQGRQQGLEQGRQQGLEQGRQQGREAERICTIHQLEALLGRPATPAADLARCDLDELGRIVDQLLDQLRPAR